MFMKIAALCVPLLLLGACAGASPPLTSAQMDDPSWFGKVGVYASDAATQSQARLTVKRFYTALTIVPSHAEFRIDLTAGKPGVMHARAKLDGAVVLTRDIAITASPAHCKGKVCTRVDLLATTNAQDAFNDFVEDAVDAARSQKTSI